MSDNKKFIWTENNGNISREFWFIVPPPKQTESKEIPDIVTKWFSPIPPKPKQD
jgi:hypothetical protein